VHVTKSVGKPDAGNPHVRFDERGTETGLLLNEPQPRRSSTLPFRLLLDRADPNQSDSGRTILHTVMAQGEKEHVPYVEMLLDHGARIDIRDELLKSTALGWACRWGRVHFVKLLLERGADPIETDAELWATPRAWAQKMKHDNVLQVLLNYRPK